MEKGLEEYLKHLEEVKKFANQVTEIPTIEERDPNFVYLMHHTSLTERDTEDVYLNGIAYEGNDLSRTFNNLSQDWLSKSWAKDKADLTSMEEVIVEQCKRGNFQCFLYKIPLAYFEPVDEEFFPIPIWNLDRDYVYKENPSSSGVKYDFNQEKKTFFRLNPKLLLGHYDLRTNKFYRNSDYSEVLDNPHGVFDSRQIMKLSSKEEFQDFWQHNTFILEGKPSPFEKNIHEISVSFSEKENGDAKGWK